ncbi:MAG: SDR family oxidoreductase [Alphaproteobacteria bacterium]
MTLSEPNTAPNTAPGTALVTGAAHRIGQAIALGLAADGWAVAIHYHRSQDAAESLSDDINAKGGRAVAVAADLTDEDQTAALLPDAGKVLGPINCLVNNASVFEHDDVASATRESWDAHIETNLRAPFVLTQCFARQLPKDMTGNVINLLDQRVANLTPYFLSYTLSKSGLWSLTRTLALALAPRIRVNGIAPGPVLPSARQSAEQFAGQSAATPLGRAITPEEIYAGVRFILQAEAMTGQMIALDSGQHLNWSAARGNGAED